MTLFFVTTFRLKRATVTVTDYSSPEFKNAPNLEKDFSAYIDFCRSLPKCKKTVWKVKNSRTPIFFDNMEDAKLFVESNQCDWEEAGYYNMAFIEPLESNKCYTRCDPQQCLLYSSEEGWIDIAVTLDCNHYFIYKDLEIADDIGVGIG